MTYLVGIYVIFRCVETLCRSKDAWSSETARVVMQVASFLTITGAILCAFLGDTVLTTRR